MPFDKAQFLEATLFGLVASTDDMREGTRGVSREAQAGVQGDVVRASCRCCEVPLRRRRLPRSPSSCRASTRRSRAAAGRARGRRCARPASPTTTSRSCSVPGAFELPLAALRAAETGRFDAVICLGCLIKGDTMHFEYIAAAVAHGHHGGVAGDRRADGVRRADDATRGAGEARAGDGPRQQGPRGGAGGGRDGDAVPARCDAEPATGELNAGVGRDRSRGTARARRRCRCSTSGRSARPSDATTCADVLAEHRTTRRRCPTSIATFATALCRRRRRARRPRSTR